MPSAEKANGVSGNDCPRQQPVLRRIAAPSRRIFGIELGRHDAEGLARQGSFERAARAVDEKDVVAFLDARCLERDLANDAQRHRRERQEPRPAPRRDRARRDDDGGGDQQRVAKEIVDRQPEPRDHQHQRGELEPRLLRRRLAVGGIFGGQCSAPGLAGRYRVGQMVRYSRRSIGEIFPCRPC